MSQKLFNHMSDEHNLTLLQGEMHEIQVICDSENTSLISKVKEMRTNQKQYFATRSKGALIRSKELEKEVDQLITQLTNNK